MAYERGARDAVGRTIVGFFRDEIGRSHFVLDDGYSLAFDGGVTVATPDQVDSHAAAGKARLKQLRDDLTDLETLRPTPAGPR